MFTTDAAIASLRQELILGLQKLDDKLQTLKDRADLTHATLERFREEAIEIAAGFAEYIEGKQ